MNFQNKTILVTGANRGIGRQIVTTLLGKGVTKIYAGSRNPDSLPDFNDIRVIPLKLDITATDQVSQAAKLADDVDILINNAGVAAFTSLLEGSSELLRRDMETNYFGTLDMVRHFVPLLETREDAAIVNIVSIVAFVNFPVIGGYSASKSALFSLSQGIRNELSSKGIAVHTVNPGPIDTDLASEFPMEKASTESTVDDMLIALENDEADIFPDVVSQEMFGVWKKDYRQLEQMVTEMHNNP
jgi:NAD(P)-dependent dehydrogenase (short-subunit alcohol dehydrogenase family)